MIKRNVRYRIENETVVPAIPQYGGVKGEHNATVVAVTMENVLYEDGDAVRLSFTTGDGTVLSSDLLDDVLYTEGTLCVEYALPQLLTVSAGQLCMRLVLSRFDENGREVQTCRSPEMVLYFEDASLENGTPFWTGVSEMLARTATACAASVQAQETAKENQIASLEAASNANSAKDEALLHAQEAGHHAANAEEAAQSAKTSAERAEEAVDTPGRRGASAYEVAVENGFNGDEEAWLMSLKGEEGESAYDAVVKAGYDGTEAAFNKALLKMMHEGYLRYVGACPNDEWLMNMTTAEYGHVIYVMDEQRFYVWVGEWKSFGAGASGGQGSTCNLTRIENMTSTPIYWNNLTSGAYLMRGLFVSRKNDYGEEIARYTFDADTLVLLTVNNDAQWETNAIEAVIYYPDGIKIEYHHVIKTEETMRYYMGHTETFTPDNFAQVAESKGANTDRFSPPPIGMLQLADDGTVQVRFPWQGNFDQFNPNAYEAPTRLHTTESAYSKDETDDAIANAIAGSDIPTSGSGDWEYIGESTPENQLIFESGKYKEFYVYAYFTATNISGSAPVQFCVDGGRHFLYEFTAEKCSVYGVLYPNVDIYYPVKTAAKYLMDSSRGNAQIALCKSNANTTSLGTCFWVTTSSETEITGFGIKLWGRT